LIAAIASAVARSPSSVVAGLPGSARIHMKTRIESPRRIGMRSRTRRTTKRSMSPAGP
jgi:hypothetical protein